MKVSEPMTREEELVLVPLARSGDQKACFRVVSSVLPLIRRAVNKRRKICPWAEVEDLEQAAVLGVIGAIQNFDCENGARFATYADDWWENGIREVAWDQSLRGRKGPSYYKVRKIVDGELERKVGEDTAFGAKSLLEPLSSLDVTVKNSKDLRFGDTIPNTSTEAPDESLSKIELSRALELALDTLTAREAEMIRLRYMNMSSMTLKEIALLWGVSRQRVEVVEKRVLRKIRKYLIKEFPDFFDADVYGGSGGG